MNMEQQFQEVITPMASTKGDCASSLDKCRSISSEIDGSEDNSSTTGGFDCNICLDSVQDPVVTLCGHLYCWPCIYKWIHYQGTDETLDHHQQQKPQCPVCKGEVSKGTLIPLYGRGANPKPSEGKAPHLGITVPKRPPSMMTCGFSNTETSTSPLHRRRRHSPPRSPQQHQQSPNTATAMGGGMIGEMVYARIFGNSTIDSYGHPDSYNVAANANPRLRRHLMQTDQSLGRVCFFLFCCVVLCLLLF